MVRKLMLLEDWEAEQMRDPEFVTALAELEPAYQAARLRIMRGLTQEQLAEPVGSKQRSIARLSRAAISGPRGCSRNIARVSRRSSSTRR